MDLSEAQKEARKLQAFIDSKREANFPYPSMIRCLKAQEELGEVADVLIRHYFGTRKGKVGKEKAKEMIGEEIADVLFLLFEIANNFEVDLNVELKKKLKKSQKRWKKVKKLK